MLLEDKDKYFVLNNFRKIPKLGLGTFNSFGNELINVVKLASEIGYQLFDTSMAYQNEKALSKGLWSNCFGVANSEKRKKYCITSKLFLDDCINNREYTGLKNSLKKLNTDYIDNYLLHWALPDKFVKNYKEMEKFYYDGLVRTIGVSNMEIHHLERLINECDVIPAINQVEITPLFTQKPLLDFCKKHNILVMAYTPFARMDERLFTNEKLISISKKYNKYPTQIILKWNIQQGRCVIPKTANPERLKDNFNIFDFMISDEDLNIIDSINENVRVRFHPDVYPVEWEKKYANIKTTL